jgi:hypothetical protein
MPIDPPPRFLNNTVIKTLSGDEIAKRMGRPHQGAKEQQRRRKQLARDKQKQGIAMPEDLIK